MIRSNDASTSLVAAVDLDGSIVTSIREELGEGVKIELCASPRELASLVRGGRLTGVIVGSWQRPVEELVDLVQAVRVECPDTSVWLACDQSAPRLTCIPRLVRAGVDELLLLHRSLPIGEQVRGLLGVEDQTATASFVWRKVRVHLNSRISPAVHLCLVQALGRASVQDLARGLRCSPRTLQYRIAKGGDLTPRQLVSWCRLLMAARMLDEGKRTVEQVALRLQFDSGAGLRNMLKRYTGYTAHDLRRLGGLDTVIALLVRRVETRVDDI